MKYLIVYAHPNPSSFNHAVKEIVEEKLRKSGKYFETRDLYAMKFNPTLSADDFTAMKDGKLPADIQKEQDHIRNANVIIFIHPIWWFGMPAILKGYIDRVFSYGFAYDFAEKGPRGLLTDKKVVIFNTTGGAEDNYRSGGHDKALRKNIDTGTFEFCGMQVALHEFFYAVPFVTDDVRHKMLEELGNLTALPL